MANLERSTKFEKLKRIFKKQSTFQTTREDKTKQTNKQTDKRKTEFNWIGKPPQKSITITLQSSIHMMPRTGEKLALLKAQETLRMFKSIRSFIRELMLQLITTVFIKQIMTGKQAATELFLSTIHTQEKNCKRVTSAKMTD